MKKIVGYIVIIVLIIAAALGIYFGIKYKQTQDQIKSSAEYIETINNLQDELKIVKDGKSEIAIKLNAAELENKQYKEDLKNVNILLEERNAKITELETNAEENAQELQSLHSEVSSLTEQKNTLISKIAEHEATISGLQAEKINLENRIVELTAELQAYKDMELTGVYKINFIDDETLVNCTYVDEGKKLISPPKMQNTDEVWYYGWSTENNSTEVVDLSDYTPAADTTFYAVKSGCVSIGIKNSLDSADEQQAYRVGERLTVGEVLNFSQEVNWDEIALTVGNTEISLNTNVVDLPYGNIVASWKPQGGKEEDRLVVKGYDLKYSVKYKYQKTMPSVVMASSGNAASLYISPSFGNLRIAGLVSTISLKIGVYNSKTGVAFKEETVSLTEDGYTFTSDKGSITFKLVTYTSGSFDIEYTSKTLTTGYEFWFSDVKADVEINPLYVTKLVEFEELDKEKYAEAYYQNQGAV